MERVRSKFWFLAWPMYFCILVCLDVAFRWLYRTGDSFSWQNLTPLLFTIGWAAVMTGVAAILPRRLGRIWVIFTCTLFAVLTLVHAVMFNLFGSFFSLQDLVYAGDGAKFFSLTYLKIRKGLVLCAVLAVLGAVVCGWLLGKRRWSPWRLFALLPLAAGAALILHLHTPLIYTAPESEPGVMTWDTTYEKAETVDPAQLLYTEFTNSNGCMNLTGLYHYTVRNAVVTLAPASVDEQRALQAIEDWSEENEPALSAWAGSLEGKNLIMVMLESIDTFLLTEEYMPNLYAVQQQSVNFVNHYTPLYITAGTFGTEFVSQTGIIPPQTGVSTDVYVENTFSKSLPLLFRGEGYRVNSFHSASRAIYNRGAIHENLGFEAYHPYTDMGMDDYQLDSQMIRGFDLMVSDEPFYSFIITYSGHGPYDSSMSNISDPHLERAEAAVAASGVTASAENMSEYTLAVAHAMETDAFVGALMAALEESGHLEDTVVVFYADHYCKYMTDTEFLMELKGVSNRNLLCNTPFFIYSSDLEPRTVEKLTSSVDIYPTVCSLFGLDVDLSCFVGSDALAEGESYVYWRDYSWYDGTRYVDGSTVPEDEYGAEISAAVRRKLNLSWNMIIYDYFGRR